jgi:glutamyl-tRNA synthetase
LGHQISHDERYDMAEMADDPIPTTRLAPSPTGALHLGNARSFMVNWALARQRGWRVLMRMEDLDGPRVKAGAADQALDILQWLGLDWDGSVSYQSANFKPYQDALERLHAGGYLYHCQCSRKEIAAAQSAPHGGGEMRYPGTCRPNLADGHSPARIASDAATSPLMRDDAVAWRLIVPDEPVTFDDAVAGPQEINVQRQAGDFIVATKAGLPSYQLAVAVDDARQGVTHVVRGDDLLNSTARQIWLYRKLGLSPSPQYFHLPLVRGLDGRRLAKRHGDTRIARYRERGVEPERVIGLLAYWSGLLRSPEPMTAGQFRDGFDLAALPREPITFTHEEDQWLLSL